MVSLPERSGFLVKREKKSGFIARTIWFSVKREKKSGFIARMSWNAR
ncbi:hypothetical protein [Neobacillus niacini]|nr:hypothetical protein [Neobacillus niacini]MDR7000373.1 ribosomal protein L34 [Neobacillus niacini]